MHRLHREVEVCLCTKFIQRLPSAPTPCHSHRRQRPCSSTSLVRTSIVHHRVTEASISRQDTTQRDSNSLWKHLDSTTAEPLVTNTTHPVLRNEHVSLPPATAAGNAVAESELRLFAEHQTASQRRSHPASIDHRVRRPDSTSEVRFQFLDR